MVRRVPGGRRFGGEFLDEREDVVGFFAGLSDEFVVPFFVELFLRRAGVGGGAVVGIEETEVVANFEAGDEMGLLEVGTQIAIF